nr:MAG TPA: hypothetical protein [Caudoviricetes sp.]
MLPGSRVQKRIRLPKASSWSHQYPAKPCKVREGPCLILAEEKTRSGL